MGALEESTGGWEEALACCQLPQENLPGGPGPAAVTGLLLRPPLQLAWGSPAAGRPGPGRPSRGPWKGWAEGSGGQREGRGRAAVRSSGPGTPLHPGARAAARVCQPPRGARPGARWPLHLPDRPLFGGQEKTTVPPLTAAHLLAEGRAPAPLTSSKSAFPPPGPAGPQTEMDGSGCLWKKSPEATRPRGAGFSGREGTPLLVVVGVAGGGRGKACVRRMVGRATPEPPQGAFGISPIVCDKQACPWRHGPASGAC